MAPIRAGNPSGDNWEGMIKKKKKIRVPAPENTCRYLSRAGNSDFSEGARLKGEARSSVMNATPSNSLMKLSPTNTNSHNYYSLLKISTLFIIFFPSGGFLYRILTCIPDSKILGKRRGSIGSL